MNTLGHSLTPSEELETLPDRTSTDETPTEPYLPKLAPNMQGQIRRIVFAAGSAEPVSHRRKKPGFFEKTGTFSANVFS